MSDKKIDQCPVCGSENFSQKTEQSLIEVGLGRTIEVPADFLICQDCGFEGSKAGANDERIGEEVDAARRGIQVELIESLSSRGYKMAHVERVLGLPQRTIVQWKKGGTSASFALLAFVSKMPWLLKIAEHKFSDHAIDYYVAQAGAESMARLMWQAGENQLRLCGAAEGNVMIAFGQNDFLLHNRSFSRDSTGKCAASSVVSVVTGGNVQADSVKVG